jgi:chromosome segregation ATPase
MEQKSTITGAEMLDHGREYRRQMESIALQVQVQAEQAKAEKDVIRLNCLLDKLTQVKVNVNIMDQTLQALQDDISRNDESGELHEYTRITIVNQKAQVLRTEADACVGAETSYVGRTKLVVESPPGLDATVDQPAPAAPPISIVDRPLVASPFQ